MTIELLWNHLAQNPVLWLCLTLLAYQAGIWVYQKSGYLTLLSPFVIAVSILLAILFATHTKYETIRPFPFRTGNRCPGRPAF